jgi:2-(1,2-epoxy-1,2-dihydrophenyl)acetyl-CoA isomerase
MSSSPKAEQQPQEAPVIQEKRDGAILTLILSRPEKMNALNKYLAIALNETLGRVLSDKEISVVVLTGAGRAFCSGGDLGVIGKGRQENDITDLEPLLRSGAQAVLKLHTMRQPVIAAINGPAAGAGMNIALACDIRIASENATFGQNFAKVGLYPDYGGTFFLPQLVGPAKAAELFYTGDMIDAQTALRLGIVNRVVPAADLEAEAHALAKKIADGPGVAIRAVKQAVFGGSKDRLAKVLEHEVQEQLKCFLSEDCSEGIRAFREKRKPKFQGK